jgi:deoxyadenosine/deoxycytidine kinase
MAILITVDGNLGVGKSTLLEYLKSFPYIRNRKLIVIEERVSEWVENGLLKLYYDEPERHSFCFQLYVLVSRAHLIWQAMEQHPNAVIVSERTSLSDYMFATMLYESGTMTECEYKVYQMVYSNLNKGHVAARIVLDCPAEEVHERCKNRNRPGEEKLTLSYLKKVEEYVNEYLKNDPYLPLVTIKTNTHFHDVSDSALIFLEEIVHKNETYKFKLFCLRSSIALAVVLALANCVCTF